MNKSTFLIVTLAILCLVSKIAANGPYTRLFFTSSDCSEESRIAYYYMPTAAVRITLLFIMPLLRNESHSKRVNKQVALRSLLVNIMDSKTARRELHNLRTAGL